MEYKYQKPLFYTGYHDITEKYMLTLFALRRLLFHLSDASAEDAVLYLQHNPVSVFAVYVITQDALVQPNSALYQKIAEIYSDCWSEGEYRLFLSLTQAS